MRLDLLTALNEERRARRAAVLVTQLETGAQFILRESDFVQNSAEESELRAAAAEAARSGRSGCAAISGVEYFLEAHAPPPRLILIGAGHIAQALSVMARMTGFDVVVVDPRAAFATPERFPDIPLFVEWPDAAAPMRALDAQTAVAALAHDPKIDDPALSLALAAPCFYVGALGSRKSHDKRIDRLSPHFPKDVLARIRAPVGLDIGALTPQEIAVSILAELIRARGRKPARAAAP